MTYRFGPFTQDVQIIAFRAWGSGDTDLHVKKQLQDDSSRS